MTLPQTNDDDSFSPEWVEAQETVGSTKTSLFAAAPEMLEFCIALRDRYNVDDRLGGLGDWCNQLIAKATGQAVPA